jgi:two-component system, chemotaxis family, chemotaxis protein CheY
MDGYRFDKLKLLVADDNQHMRKLISTIMRAFGTTSIYECDSGEAAWQIIKRTGVDIVIVDWQMAGMTGLDFVRQIRNAPDSPNPFLPVIMLTGYTHIDHVRLARDAGANEFLAKPVTVKALMAKIASVIENPRPFVRPQTYFGPCRRRRNDLSYKGPERRAAPDAVDVDSIAPVDGGIFGNRGS